ncbi:MAG: hypothetical protein M3680_09760 [Myxococcota bacterium]|nr:hypothetical protein [Myxococcota bacterium]
MKRLLVVIALGTLASTAAVLAQGSGAPASQAPPAPSMPASPAAAVVAKHFSHADHATRNVDVTRCESCHRLDPTGTILAPAAQGHAPCLDAKCHATDFLAVGMSEKTRKAGPAFDKAAAFCAGCHAQVPWPWKQAATRIVPSFRAAREYHVEMNHFDHATRAIAKGTSCRGCHVVDAKSFALVTGAPGHAQCQGCHNAKDFPAFTMAQCGLCHQAPSREQYFKQQLAARGITRAAPRPSTNVRSCDSEAYLNLAKKQPKLPCFKHERLEHRTETGKPGAAELQCAKCHYVVADKSSARTHQSLVDLRVRPIIDNDRDRQHASCGRSGCHEREVKTATCAESFCHADMSVY